MATFKATVRGERADGFMQVYIRVTHNRAHGYIKTDKMITRKELGKSKEITDPFVMNYCTALIMEYNDLLNHKDISKWAVSEVVEFLVKGSDDICFSDYARLTAVCLLEPSGIDVPRSLYSASISANQ